MQAFWEKHVLPIAKALSTVGVLFLVFLPGLLDPWGSKSQQLMTTGTWGTVDITREGIEVGGDHETSLRLFYKALKTDVVFDAQVPAPSSQERGCHFTQPSVGAWGVGCENGASLQGILRGN